MNVVRKLIREIYDICNEDLDANYGYTEHLEYIEYRILGGRKTEEKWFAEQCKPTK